MKKSRSCVVTLFVGILAPQLAVAANLADFTEYSLRNASGQVVRRIPPPAAAYFT